MGGSSPICPTISRTSPADTSKSRSHSKSFRGRAPAVRIHLGHHFYGAGNLGDDFMLAGFLGAMRTLAPSASFTCCVPFALEPLRTRFPSIEWQVYDEAVRARCIAQCDVWLGLGGSPFQSG